MQNSVISKPNRLTKIITSLSLVVLVGFLTVAVNVVIGRFYGSAGLGLYGTVVSIAQIGGTLFGSSLGLWAITKLPSIIATNSNKASQVVNDICITLILVLVPIALIIPFAFDFGAEGMLPIVFTVAIIATAIQNLSRDVLRCYSSLVRSYIVLISANVTGIIVIFSSLNRNINLFQLESVLLISYLTSISVSFAIILKHRQIKISPMAYGLAGNGTSIAKKRNIVSSNLTSFLPMVIAVVAQVALARTDIVISNYFGSASLAGELTAAVTLASVTLMGLAALNAIYVPKINAAQHRERLHILKEVQKYGLLITVCACAFIFTFDDFLVQLFGFESQDSALALKVLMVGSVVNAVTGPVLFIGLRISDGKPVAKILLLAVVANLIGDLLVFQSFSIVGLAVVTAIVGSATNIAVLVMIYKEK